jgi:hypothetical protein
MLRLLDEGGVHSTAELARGLRVSEGLVAAMTEDLARRGYLARVGADCATACGTSPAGSDRCALSGVCAGPLPAGAGAVLFALTETGKYAAQRYECDVSSR